MSGNTSGPISDSGTGTRHDITLTKTLTASFANFVDIGNNEIMHIQVANQANLGGTYANYFLYYNTTEGLTTMAINQNNISWQYSAGFIQWKSVNGATYAMTVNIKRGIP